MTSDESIVELGCWLRTPPGRYMLAWEQDRLDRSVTDAFGFHALQLGLPELDGLRANRMPHRWVASGSLLVPEALSMPPPTDEHISTLSANEPVSLEAELAIAKAAASSARDDYLRALAEQDNIRKRAMTDIAQARDFASKNFAMDLLGVRDTLEAVLADKVSTPEQLKMGVDMTLKQLAGAFERNKVKEVNPVGQKFDPNLHQAMQEVESEQVPGTVTQVMQKGYVLADRLLRPAMVLVAKVKLSDVPPASG